MSEATYGKLDLFSNGTESLTEKDPDNNKTKNTIKIRHFGSIAEAKYRIEPTIQLCKI